MNSSADSTILLACRRSSISSCKELGQVLIIKRGLDREQPLQLTTFFDVVIMSNMEAVELICTRIIYSESAFAELVLWRLPESLDGSLHKFKYRLAYVVNGECVLRYDNEAGKGDHRHFGEAESAYLFTSPEQLIADFQKDIERWRNEDRNS